MYMNNTDSSFGQTELDTLINEYQIETADNIIVNINEYEINDYDNNRFVAEFEYADVQYRLTGIIEKREFDKIIENLIFYNKNA